jgi:undecaprenyl-diphosphatase
MLTMGQPYGPGASRFGPISVIVLVLLGALVIIVWWVARHPVADLRQRAREAASAQRLLEWAHRRIRSSDCVPVQRFAEDGVAAAALLAGLVLSGALSFGFAELLEDVLEGDGIAVFDPTISWWLAGHRDLWLTTALRVVTALGSPAILAPVVILSGVAASWRRKTWLPAILAVVGACGAGLIIVAAKVVVGRDRPPTPFAVIAEGGFSFPSGHATGTAVVALLSAWLLTRWLIDSWAGRVAMWATAVGVAAAVGFSRVYLGVHYVSDVLAGWLLGAAWACTIIVVGAWRDDIRRTREARTSH